MDWMDSSFRAGRHGSESIRRRWGGMGSTSTRSTRRFLEFARATSSWRSTSVGTRHRPRSLSLENQSSKSISPTSSSKVSQIGSRCGSLTTTKSRFCRAVRELGGAYADYLAIVAQVREYGRTHKLDLRGAARALADQP